MKKRILAKKKTLKKVAKQKASLLFYLYSFLLFSILFSSVLLLLPKISSPHTYSRASAEYVTTQIPTISPSPSLAVTPAVQSAAVSLPSQNSYCLTVPILLYHHIEPIAEATKAGHAQLTVDSEIFDQQMKYLNDQGYHSLSADELAQALLNKSSVLEKSILITIDDAYLDNYEYAFPILKKYSIKGNFMVPTGLVMNPGYMTWDNVREIENSEIGFIYNHTWSHAALGNLEKATIEYELRVSQQQFQEQIGKRPTIFTYPYGSFNDEAIDVVKEQGFIAAFTTLAGKTQCSDNVMTLYRDHVGNAPLSSYGL